MLYVSGAYRIAATGPLMETMHVTEFPVADLSAYLTLMQVSSGWKDVPLKTWTLGSEPDRWHLNPVDGRGPGYLVAYANRDDLDIRFEVIRHAPTKGGPSDGTDKC